MYEKWRALTLVSPLLLGQTQCLPMGPHTFEGGFFVVGRGPRLPLGAHTLAEVYFVSGNENHHAVIGGGQKRVGTQPTTGKKKNERTNERTKR